MNFVSSDLTNIGSFFYEIRLKALLGKVSLGTMQRDRDELRSLRRFASPLSFDRFELLRCRTTGRIRIDLERPEKRIKQNNYSWTSIDREEQTSRCLVRSGIPILKHASWMSCMQARAAEVNEGGAISDSVSKLRWEKNIFLTASKNHVHS
jgi:hypothetical protein